MAEVQRASVLLSGSWSTVGFLCVLELCYVSFSAPPGKVCTGLRAGENGQCL